jgi:hypothetical protein
VEHSPSELKTALENVEWEGAAAQEPMRAWSALNAVATSLRETNPAAADAVTILGHVIGMVLDPERWDAPYSPLMNFGDRRTAIPEDLSDRDLGFLESLLPELEPTQLSARIADVLFIRTLDKSRKYGFARESVHRWRDLGLSGDLSRDGEQGWHRAAQIAARFKMVDEIDQLSKIALEAIRTMGGLDAWQVARAARRAGYARDFAQEIASLLHNHSDLADPHLRREVLAESASWSRIAGAEVSVADIQQEIGDSWWAEAKERRLRSHLIARDFFGNAYNDYRSTQRSLRSNRTAKRLRRLPRIIREEGVLSLEEMTPISSGPIDLTLLRDMAQRATARADTLDALAQWFAGVPLDTFDAAAAQAQKGAQDAPFAHLITRSAVAGDGRKVHSTDSDKQRLGVSEAIWAQMIRDHGFKIGLLTAGYIWPALQEFSALRKLTRGDFEVIVRSSPFVPVEQEWHYANVLYNGYYGRLSDALFMLAPVMEACVRACLQRAGIETRAIRMDDTEIEPGLSALMELDGVDEALGKDLAWNIRALYCGPLGPNLRNRVAHGLMGHEESGGGEALFAWWFAFRLAFVPYYNVARPNGPLIQEEEAAADVQPEE